MTTGRRIAADALREPLADAGWRARAAGWFTTMVGEGQEGVLALGTASEHARPGSALATLYVGLRSRRVEPIVARLAATPDDGYRTRTAVTSIGYLAPEARWQEWAVTEASAAAAAEAMAANLQQYGLPWLQHLAADTDALLEAVRASPSVSQSPGACRFAVLLGRAGRSAEARVFLSERTAALEARTDAAAGSERAAVIRTLDWLANQ